MTGEEWALAATVFVTWLAAGFLGALCTIIRPMQAAMDGQGFRNFMEAFLRYADHGLGKQYNLAWAFVPVLGSIVALVLVWNDPGSTSFILTAIGLGIVLVGIWLVSNVWKTPNLQADPVLGSRGSASGLEGGTAALFHEQLDPSGRDLGGVRAVPRRLISL
jgi:hypothetical protein